jgi:hypothetical protein
LVNTRFTNHIGNHISIIKCRARVYWFGF